MMTAELTLRPTRSHPLPDRDQAEMTVPCGAGHHSPPACSTSPLPPCRALLLWGGPWHPTSLSPRLPGSSVFTSSQPSFSGNKATAVRPPYRCCRHTITSESHGEPAGLLTAAAGETESHRRFINSPDLSKQTAGTSVQKQHSEPKARPHGVLFDGPTLSLPHSVLPGDSKSPRGLEPGHSISRSRWDSTGWCLRGKLCRSPRPGSEALIWGGGALWPPDRGHGRVCSWPPSLGQSLHPQPGQRRAEGSRDSAEPQCLTCKMDELENVLKGKEPDTQAAHGLSGGSRSTETAGLPPLPGARQGLLVTHVSHRHLPAPAPLLRPTSRGRGRVARIQ
ncbi:uncharacterized protein LOC123930948 [Meles meles]|uniref:uncharacterized protein LOC123930948 n=1 Tax=Meles meles TaxID=9662 RepID=UPI001E699C0A|nr:uncharacterized protein LOC123930948 [Meles meles]